MQDEGEVARHSIYIVPESFLSAASHSLGRSPIMLTNPLSSPRKLNTSNGVIRMSWLDTSNCDSHTSMQSIGRCLSVAFELTCRQTDYCLNSILGKMLCITIIKKDASRNRKWRTARAKREGIAQDLNYILKGALRLVTSSRKSEKDLYDTLQWQRDWPTIP